MRTKGQLKADGYDIRIPCGRYVAYTGPHHTTEGDYPIACAIADSENAARLVECWNACEQMENPGEAIAFAINALRLADHVRGTRDDTVEIGNALREALERLTGEKI